MVYNNCGHINDDRRCTEKQVELDRHTHTHTQSGGWGHLGAKDTPQEQLLSALGLPVILKPDLMSSVW